MTSILRRLLLPPLRRFLRVASGQIMAHRYRHECQVARERLSVWLPRVAAFLDQQQRDGGLHHDYSELKLLELAQLLERFQPRTVLELGGGSTTAVFAEYASRNPSAHVLSVDQSDTWQRETQQRLHPELRARVHFAVADRVVEVVRGAEVCSYDPGYLTRLQHPSLDFVYVDGPANDSPTRPGSLMPCVDAVNLIARGFRPRAIAFDYRISSVHYLCSTPYVALFDALLHHECLRETDLWNVVDTRHHSLFVLREGAYQLVALPAPGR
jgi:hypothetical protein